MVSFVVPASIPPDTAYPQPMSDRSPAAVALSVLTPARLVLNTAHRFVYPFLPVIARGLGISLESAGALISARWAMTMTTPFVVRAVGPEHRRRLISAGLVFFAFGAAVTAATSLWLGALIGFAAMGLGKSTFDASAQAHIADRVPYERRGRALAVLELTWAGGFLIGAPAAGWLIDRGGWQVPFWVTGGLALAAVAAVVRLIEPDPHRSHATLAALMLDRSSTALLVTMGVFSGSSELMFTALGAWLEGSFGLSILVIGGVATLLGVAELAGEAGVMTWADRIGKRRAVGVGLIIAALAYAATAIFHDSRVLGLGFYSLALAGFEFTIVSAIPLASEARPTARARFLALMIVAIGLGRAVGAFVGPGLFERFGVAANAWIASAGNVVALVILLLLVAERTGSERPRAERT